MAADGGQNTLRLSHFARTPAQTKGATGAPFACSIQPSRRVYSTVTLLARLRGLSTSVPRASAVWYASNCTGMRSEEHTSELQSQSNLVCRLLLEKKKTQSKGV